MSATVWQCKCGAKYELREEWLGRRVRCKHCGVITRVEKPSSIKAPPSIPKTSVPSRETSSLPLNKFADDREFDRERDLPDTLMQIESWDVDAALATEDAGIKTFDKLVANSVEGAIEGVVHPPVGRVMTELSDQISNLPKTLFQSSDDVSESIRTQSLDIALAAEDAGIKAFDDLVAYSVKTVGERRTREIGAYLRLAADAVGFAGVRQTKDVLAELGGVRTKDLEEEIKSLENIYRSGVATSYDLHKLGSAYHNHRDLAKAVKYFRLSAAAKPLGNDWVSLALLANTWVNLALVYSDPEISQDADAADACRRALALKPDDERAKELLERTKRKLVPLAAQALSAASGLVESKKFFDVYISPFEMLQIADMTAANGLDAKAIQQAKKRLLHELELNDGKVSWLGDYSLDKARAVAVVDELDDEAKRRYHLAIYRNKRLLNFLTRGDIQHFLYRDDYFPRDTEELLHRELGFRTFLSKPFARQYNRVLTRAIEQGRLPVVEVLFDGRRWVEPEDEDMCFDRASKRVGDIVEEMRAIVRGGSSRKVSLYEIEVFMREHSLPELFNLLPVHFASYQGEIVKELRFLAISCFKKYDEFILSRDILNLCKRFTSRDVAFNEQLQEDFKTIEAMISAERVNKTTQQVSSTQTKVRKPETKVSSEVFAKPFDAARSFLWLLEERVFALSPGLFLLGLIVLIAIALDSCSTRTSSSSLPHTPSVSSTDPVRAPTLSPPKLLPAVPLPANGTVKRYGFSEGIARLTIATRKGGGHYFVRLRTVGTGELIAEVFVREGQRASIEVPLGTYELTYATGRTWYGPKAGALFGPETGYAKADDTFTFRIDGNQILGYTVELYLQAYGNLETEPMSAREF
jgi:tetratricopeptide (TPR) repeat protein